MSRPIPINKEAAKQQLIEAYTALTGKKPNGAAMMICDISAERALSNQWEWRKEESKNWSVSLHWI